MFQKGNKLGKGRPRISLSKPELLLPVVFQKHKINWAEDFGRLYKLKKQRKLTAEEHETFKMLMDLMPFLCTKVNVKDLEASKFVSESDKTAMTDQANALIKALENGSISSSEKPSVADGPTNLPPTA